MQSIAAVVLSSLVWSCCLPLSWALPSSILSCPVLFSLVRLVVVVTTTPPPRADLRSCAACSSRTHCLCNDGASSAAVAFTRAGYHQKCASSGGSVATTRPYPTHSAPITTAIETGLARRPPLFFLLATLHSPISCSRHSFFLLQQASPAVYNTTSSPPSPWRRRTFASAVTLCNKSLLCRRPRWRSRRSGIQRAAALLMPESLTVTRICFPKLCDPSRG